MPDIVTTPCIHCGLRSVIALTDAEFAAVGTTYIQDALPDRSVGERELIKSGIHGSCWDEMFADTEED